MSRKQRRKLEQAKQRALRIHALNFDLDPDLDYFRPGNRPPERAFQVLSMGFDMAAVMMDKAFPSLDKRTVKKGRNWALEALLVNGVHCGTFLSRAAFALLARMRGWSGEDAEDGVEVVPDPRIHLSLKASIEDFYSLVRHSSAIYDVKPLLAACEAEFVVMETGEPREEVAEGEESANEFSAALLRGEDARNDPGLMEAQRLYARDWYIQQMALGGAQTSMWIQDGRKLSPKMIRYLDPNEPRLAKYRTTALAAWVEASRPLREYALIEYRSADGSVKSQWTPTGTS